MLVSGARPSRGPVRAKENVLRWVIDDYGIQPGVRVRS
jgi:hypothetical protein